MVGSFIDVYIEILELEIIEEMVMLLLENRMVELCVDSDVVVWGDIEKLILVGNLKCFGFGDRRDLDLRILKIFKVYCMFFYLLVLGCNYLFFVLCMLWNVEFVIILLVKWY